MLISFYELQILLVHFQILIYSFDLLIVFKSASRVGAKAWPWQSFQYYGHHGHLLILINLLTPEPGVGRRMDTNKARWRQGNHCPGYGGLTAGPGCVADGSLWVLLGPFASCYGAEPRARGTIRIMSPTSRSTQIKCWGKSFYVSCLINQIVLRPGSVQNKLKVSFLRSLKSLNNLFCPEVYKNCE